MGLSDDPLFRPAADRAGSLVGDGSPCCAPLAP